MFAGRFADHIPTTTLAVPDRDWSTVTVVTTYYRGRDLLPLGGAAEVELMPGVAFRACGRFPRKT